MRTRQWSRGSGKSMSIVEYMQAVLPHRPWNAQWRAECPGHDDPKMSLTVHGDLGLWYCFGCGAGGDILALVRHTKDPDGDLPSDTDG